MLRAITCLRPSVVWVCDPNNPTGTRWRRDELGRLAAACAGEDALLVLDGAYRDLVRGATVSTDARGVADVGPEGDARLDGSAPWHTTATLFSPTKAFAVPGVRAGYLIAPEEIARALRRAAPPWMLGSHGAAALRWCLSDAARAWLRETVPTWSGAAQELDEGLSELGYDLWASPTPYRLVEVGDAARLCRRSEVAGLRLRDASSFGLPRDVRIATRARHENQALVAWLRNGPRGKGEGAT